MTTLVNGPADFADEALAGFVAAHPRHVRAVRGGVVRASATPPGQVAVVLGGGSGHYPAFAGWVGPGMGHGAACGNIFASPSASQACSVARAAAAGGGVVLGFGNYAGDVLHFGQAAEQLRAEGIDTRVLPVTDDVASGPADHAELRRGIAGDLLVFKILGAAAERGLDLDDVERIGRLAIARTRSLGMAFSGCTLPGADGPLFTVPEGRMALGLGIHGEPGLSEHLLGSADDVADRLVDGLLGELHGTGRAAVLLNGLGGVSDDELFVVFRRLAGRCVEAGIELVEPVVGSQVTSLGMAGVSLSITPLDDELAELWTAPAETAAFHRGGFPARPARTDDLTAPRTPSIPPGSPASQRDAQRAVDALRTARDVVAGYETWLGELDAVAGDGDHGTGMRRGSLAAADTAALVAAAGAGVRTTLVRAAEAWSERAGGTSGALWAVGLTAVGAELGDQEPVTPAALVAAVRRGVDAVIRLGGAELGDKTMVDAVLPFADALEEAVAGGADVTGALTRAASVATAAAAATAGITARRGRSRTHGDRSLGTPDPGATSFALIATGVAGSEVPTPTTPTLITAVPGGTPT